MKRIVTLFLAITLIATGLSAQNRWSVYGGLNLSTDKDYSGYATVKGNTVTSEFSDAKYTPGGTFGVAYDICLKRNWSIQPAVEYSNQNFYSKKSTITQKPMDGEFIRQTDTKLRSHLHTFAVPVLVNYRVKVDDNVKLRFGVGPYVQGAFAGKVTTWGGEKIKVNDLYKNDRKHQFTVGIKAEMAVETGRHLSYIVGFQRPFCDSVIPKTLTINAGIRYTF